MTSLRHLPYRFVCAVGLDDGAFPSTPAPRRIRPDGARPAPRRPPAPQRRAQRLPRPAARRARAAPSQLHGPQHPRQLAAPAVGPRCRTARLRRRRDRPRALLAGVARRGASAPGRRASVAAVLDRLLQAGRPDQPPQLQRRVLRGAQGAAPAPPRRRRRGPLPRRASRSTPPTATTPRTRTRRGSRRTGSSRRRSRRPGPNSTRSRWSALPASSAIPAATCSRNAWASSLPQGDEELQDDEPFVPDWPARTALSPSACSRGCWQANRSPTSARTPAPASSIRRAASATSNSSRSCSSWGTLPARSRPRSTSRSSTPSPQRSNSRSRARRGA